MATTTNYGWTTPDDTDLVKDGAAAIRTLGSAIDTTTENLNPSTTEGDIEYRSATADTNARLAIGTAGQVLTVNSGATAPEWAAPAGGGKVLQVISATTSTDTSNSTDVYADTTLTATITPSSATSKILVFANHNAQKSAANSNNGILIKLMRGGTEIIATTIQLITETALFNRGMIPIHYLDSPATTSATTYKTQFRNFPNAASVAVQPNTAPSTIILMEIGA
jgi:hypothetical protein